MMIPLRLALLAGCALVFGTSCSAPTVHQIAVWDGPPRVGRVGLDGVKYKDREAFLAAVAALPAGSRVVWHSGCIQYRELPMGAFPRMTLEEFRAFCRKHRVRFEYSYGLASEPLVTKGFPASRERLAPGSNLEDAKVWLEGRGVTFAPGASARWRADGREIKVRNTPENLDLVGRILELAGR